MAESKMKVSELVAKINRKEIRLPAMQRRYVWRATRIRDLLDSLYRGYPSGSILTWESDVNGPVVPQREFSVEQSEGSGRSYELLLDGQQRLTSLSAIMRGEPIVARGRMRPVEILFNLEHPSALSIVTEVHEGLENVDADNTMDPNLFADAAADDDSENDESADASANDLQERMQMMAFVVKSARLSLLPHWISVTDVFQNEDNNRFILRAGVDTMTDPRCEKYNQRLNKLRAIRDYQYNVHTLDRNISYEEATEIFVRVNSLGVKLRSSDLAMAQITVQWPEALAEIEHFHRECGQSGFEVDQSVLIRNMVVFATNQALFKGVRTANAQTLKDGWEKAKSGFNYAMDFLKNNAHLNGPALLSSPYLLTTLGFLANKMNFELSPSDEAKICSWARIANAKGRYSRGSSETLIEQDLASIRRGEGIQALLDNLETQMGRLDVAPSDLMGRNTQSAYFKTMFAAFRMDEAKDWKTRLIIAPDHARGRHRLQYHHIFPRSKLEQMNVDKRVINDIGNFVFISGKANRNISDKFPDEYLPDYVREQGEDILVKQCVPLDTKLWQRDNYEAFLAKRRELIAKRLNRFLAVPQ